MEDAHRISTEAMMAVLREEKRAFALAGGEDSMWQALLLFSRFIRLCNVFSQDSFFLCPCYFSSPAIFFFQLQIVLPASFVLCLALSLSLLRLLFSSSLNDVPHIPTCRTKCGVVSENVFAWTEEEQTKLREFISPFLEFIHFPSIHLDL